ncbi:MAG: hypothetical protein J6X62_03380 [Bacteroidales bacterium]|nr:hypothetical protein [Bacteroidales bacterium]
MSPTAKKIFLLLAAVAAVCLTLEPFMAVGLTTGDDLLYLITRLRGPRYWPYDAQFYATTQGRFYFLLTKPFYIVPYLVDSFLFTKAVQYAMLLIAFLLFGRLVGRLTSSHTAGLLCAFLPVASLTITPNNHIATIAYPFYFSFSMSLLVGSALMLLRYRRGGRHAWLVGSVALAAAGVLFYEQYVVFLLAGIAAVFIAGWRREGIAAMFRQRHNREQWLPYAVVVVVYVLLYVGWRRFLFWQGNDSFYEGASLSASISWRNFIELLWRLPQSALPWFPLKSCGGDIAAESADGFICTMPFVATHLTAKGWLCCLLNVCVAVALLLNIDTSKLRWRTIAIGIPLALAMAMLSHLLIALTPKYNLDWFPWLSGYVTTYFSMFGFAAAVTMVLAAVMKAASGTVPLRVPAAAVCGLLLLAPWMCNAYSNPLLAQPWQRTQARFTAIDGLVGSHTLDSIPEGSVIYNPDLYRPDKDNQGYNIFLGDDFVDQYIELKSSRHYLWTYDSATFATLSADSGDVFVMNYADGAITLTTP